MIGQAALLPLWRLGEAFGFTSRAFFWYDALL